MVVALTLGFGGYIKLISPHTRGGRYLLAPPEQAIRAEVVTTGASPAPALKRAHPGRPLAVDPSLDVTTPEEWVKVSLRTATGVPVIHQRISFLIHDDLRHYWSSRREWKGDDAYLWIPGVLQERPRGLMLTIMDSVHPVADLPIPPPVGSSTSKRSGHPMRVASLVLR